MAAPVGTPSTEVEEEDVLRRDQQRAEGGVQVRSSRDFPATQGEVTGGEGGAWQARRAAGRRLARPTGPQHATGARGRRLACGGSAAGGGG